jgi:hypothetical protein
MYPQAETNRGRLDCLDPDNFKYEITSRGDHVDERMNKVPELAKMA